MAARTELTESMVDYLKLFAQGLSNREIAKRKETSIDGPQSQLREIRYILSVSGRTRLAIEGIQRGIIDPLEVVDKDKYKALDKLVPNEADVFEQLAYAGSYDGQITYDMIGNIKGITGGAIANLMIKIKRKMGFRSKTQASVHSFVYYMGYLK